MRQFLKWCVNAMGTLQMLTTLLLVGLLANIVSVILARLLFNLPQLWCWVIVTSAVYLCAAAIISRRVPVTFSLREGFLFLGWVAVGLAAYRADAFTAEESRLPQQYTRFSELVLQQLTTMHNIKPSAGPDPIPFVLENMRQETAITESVALQSSYGRRWQHLQHQRLDCANALVANWRTQEGGLRQSLLRSRALIDAAVLAGYYPYKQEPPPRMAVEQSLMSLVRWPGLSQAQLQRVSELEHEHPLAARLYLLDCAIVRAKERMSEESVSCDGVVAEEDAIKRLRQEPAVDVLLGEPLP